MYADLIGTMVGRTNGSGLIIDYGDFNAFEDSMIGIKNHKFIPKKYLLELPGLIDLSYYVDFSNLSRSAK